MNQLAGDNVGSTTQTKALKINLDPLIYGAFAEIGAGQDIAGWFFKAGGASGTIAKTMCAYDMKVSDDIYGKTSRYVSEDRLIAMLNHEYSLLDKRLAESEGNNRTFFAIANTVSARNFKGSNECHGWLGIRYQSNPLEEPSDILLHINMLDPDNQLQQEAIGILGVNLIFSSFYLNDSLEEFLSSLLDDLSPDRLEIDVIRFKGERFQDRNEIRSATTLISEGLAKAVLLSPDGVLIQPSSVIRKKSTLVERGAFRIINEIQEDSFLRAKNLFQKDKNIEPIFINEFSIKSLHQQNDLSPEQAVDVVKSLLLHKSYVMLTSFSWFYHVSQYLRRYTEEPIAFVMGVSTVIKLFNEKLYDKDSGELLEAIGRLLSIGVKIISYPMSEEAILGHLKEKNLSDLGWVQVKEIKNTNQISLSEIEPLSNKIHLYRYLLSSEHLVGLDELT